MSEQLEPGINERWDHWTTWLTVFLYQRDAAASEHTSREIGQILREAGFTSTDGRSLEINLSATAAGTSPEPPEGRMLEMSGAMAHIQWRLREDLSLVEVWLSLLAEPSGPSSLLGADIFTADIQTRLVKTFTSLCCLPGFECGGGYYVSRQDILEEWYEEGFVESLKDGKISLEQLTRSESSMVWFPLFLGNRFVRRLGREKLLQCPGRPVLSPTEDVVCIYSVPFDPCLVLPDDGPRAGIGQRIREYLRKLVIESEGRGQTK